MADQKCSADQAHRLSRPVGHRETWFLPSRDWSQITWLNSIKQNRVSKPEEDYKTILWIGSLAKETITRRNADNPSSLTSLHTERHSC